MMDDEYMEELIKKVMFVINDNAIITHDELEMVIEHAIRNLITKVVLHTQIDEGIGEP